MGDHAQSRRDVPSIILCFLIPGIIIVALWFMGVRQSIFYFGILLLCPIVCLALLMKQDDIMKLDRLSLNNGKNKRG